MCQSSRSVRLGGRSGKTTFLTPTGRSSVVSCPPRFTGHLVSIAVAVGTLTVISSSPAALTLTAIAFVVAVSVFSMVVLTAVLGQGRRHQAALTLLRVVLGRRRTSPGQNTERNLYPGSSLCAVHRSIVIVDIEGFGDKRRANWHQVAVRDGLYRAMENAFDHAGIGWADCDHEDRGDGVFVLIPPEVPKELLAGSLPTALAAELDRHNGTHEAAEQIRLRMVIHAGEVRYDGYGTTAAAVNLAFRLLDADALKVGLASSPGVLAIIVSEWFFQEVVRHSPACDATNFRRVQVAVKETTAAGWIYIPYHKRGDDRAIVGSPPGNTCDDRAGAMLGNQAA
jgi:hypothetical protein